jgi:hypothetical protein
MLLYEFFMSPEGLNFQIILIPKAIWVGLQFMLKFSGFAPRPKM